MCRSPDRLPDRRYYRDAQQPAPTPEPEEPAPAQAERKALDPDQLLREAEEEAGNLDEVRAPRAGSRHRVLGF